MKTNKVLIILLGLLGLILASCNTPVSPGDYRIRNWKSAIGGRTGIMSFRDEIPTAPGSAPRVIEYQASTVNINADGYFSYSLKTSGIELLPLVTSLIPSGCIVSNTEVKTAVAKPVAFDNKGKRYNITITNREPGRFLPGTVLVFAAIYVDSNVTINGTCKNEVGMTVTASVNWKAGMWNYYGIEIKEVNQDGTPKKIIVRGFDLPKNSGLSGDPGLAWCVDGVASCFGETIDNQGLQPGRNLSQIRPLAFIK